MSHLQAAMIRSIQGFATELTRTPLYDCGHADAWDLVERAGTTEDLLVALGYCAGYADCARIAWPSRTKQAMERHALALSTVSFRLLERSRAHPERRAKLNRERKTVAESHSPLPDHVK
jgi:hypothetical protein